MENEGAKKIGDVAELLGTTPRTLRFYEEEGLVAACRTPGGTRVYAEADIARFRAILRLAEAGMPLGLIKRLATTRRDDSTGAESGRAVHTLFQDLATQVDAQIRALVQLKEEMAFAAETVTGCFHCGNPPTRDGCPQCPVNRNLAASDLLNLIWEQRACPGGKQS